MTSKMSEPLGIIHPSPELRGIVDSTAKYVAKNGEAFEERIMREHKGKPKFSFLFPEDPFNAYYKHKVKELRQNILNENAKQTQKENDNIAENEVDQRIKQTSETDRVSPKHDSSYDNNDQQSHEVIHEEQDEQDEHHDESIEQDDTGPKVRPKLDEYMQEITLKLEEPPDLNFLANPASFITHLESDIIKLTSQYIATYGRSFLLELVSREQGNSRFDFLRPQHGQFPYMTNLIMQYALIMNAPLDMLEQLEKDSTNYKHVLDRIKMRSEWNKMLELENKRREDAEENEKILYSQIDWHDFVVVETIDYQSDEVGAYPPTTPDQVGTRLLMQQRTEDHTIPEEMEIDMDMDLGEDND